MATSPAPDAAAPPGMCPGVAVLGGGGGSGDGDGDGSGGKDGNGGDGNGNGADGSGDGKGGAGCGSGSQGGCSNCSSKVGAGDPVDVITGEVFTLPQTDLSLPGFFNLDLVRSYSSLDRARDIGLGWGWRHSLAWDMHVERSRVVVHDGFGRTAEFPALPEVGAHASLGSWGLTRTSDGYDLRPGNEFIHSFVPDPRDARVLRLAAISYRNRGRVTLHYEHGRLARIIDTAGRLIVLGAAAGGRIGSISVAQPGGRTIVFARYEYDSMGDLVSATDADGNSFRYVYDDEHMLVQQALPTGLRFHFVYDVKGRCVETWGDHAGKDPALAGHLPPMLADGETRAKGIYHCKIEYSGDGYSEVIDSVRLRRFFGDIDGHITKAVGGRGGVITRTFDAARNMTSQTDALDATTQYTYDALGNVVEEIDPEDRTVAVIRDDEGRVLRMKDPAGGEITYERDAHGDTTAIRDQMDAITRFAYNQRGLLVATHGPLGPSSFFDYDDHANLVGETHPNGATTRYEYDYWGRRVQEIDACGNRARFTYSDSGRVLSITDRLGRTKRFEYDGLGDVVAVTTPDGQTTQHEWGGFRWPTRVIYPNGEEVRGVYNREGWLTEVRNERGELHQFDYDAEGMIIEERMFNGRRRKFRQDAMNRVVSVDDGRGKVEIRRNKVGQIIACEAEDGTTYSFKYDARGELIGANTPDVEFEWQLDPVGNVVREVQKFVGATYVVDTARDLSGARTAMRTSLGHSVAFRRDGMGNVSEVWADGTPVARFTRDAFGVAVRRDLAGGGAILDTYDQGNRLRQREVIGPRSRAAVGEGEPEWLGASSGDLVHKVYEYTVSGEVSHVSTAEGGTIEFEYDVRGHVLRKSAPGRPEERFSVEPGSNYHEVGTNQPRREYGHGSELLRRGATEYIYDERGFLIEKRRPASAGASPLRWRFEWDPFDLLKAVDLPDGRRVEFQYDAFARRMGKRVLGGKESGPRAVISTTHYVWDLQALTHEIEFRRGAAELKRTYLFTDNDEVTPIGHRVAGTSDWLHYVGDLNGAPEEVVDGAGRLVGRLERTTFGITDPPQNAAARTPFRYPGQIEDEETGLHYNRYRYYDPETGTYISPDPTGLEGGYNLYAYGPNPIAWIDPMGWAHHMTVVSAVDGNRRPIKMPRTSYESGMGPDCPKALKSQAKCHTERKLAHDLKQLEKSGVKLEGGKIVVKGQYPPCMNCHRAMHALAQKHGVELEYQWKQGKGGKGPLNSMTYSKGSNPAPSGDKAEALAKAYGMSRDKNRPDGYKFDSYKKARKEYTKQSNEIGPLK
ncbi:RHS repeat-associated core domain-containing protein [Sorangium sp. So ce260]|uniref:RHS repeat-associated core domain-containing protein n=1 Tax=Sorangium sp. So ce260 TaxID=3133291 RepID=UPI003F601733